MIMVRFGALLIGYLFGLIQTSYIYGKLKGIDIRSYGSGNAGTTNTLRVLGARAGMIVLLGDILKCVVAIVLVRALFSGNYGDMKYLLAMYAAAGVILGHNFPFYLHFKGGKGVAATAGLVFAFHPYFLPLEVVLFLGIFFTTHYVSLASLTSYAVYFLQIVVAGQLGLFGMTQAHLIELYVLTGLLTALAFWKHRENIGRLLRHEERKTYLTKKNKEALSSEKENAERK